MCRLSRHAPQPECRLLENHEFSDCTSYYCGAGRKTSLERRFSADRGAINALLLSAAGGSRLLCSANATPVPLKNRLLSGFSLIRCFSAAQALEKRKSGVTAAKKFFRFINRLIIFRCRGRRALPCRDRHASRSPARSIR